MKIILGLIFGIALGFYGFNAYKNVSTLKPIVEYCQEAPKLMKHRMNLRALKTFLGPHRKTLFKDAKDIQIDLCKQWKEALQWWKLNFNKTFVAKQNQARKKRILQSAIYIHKRCTIAYPNLIIGMAQGYRGMQNQLTTQERSKLRKEALRVCKTIKTAIESFSKTPKPIHVWDLGKGLPAMLKAMRKRKK